MVPASGVDAKRRSTVVRAPRTGLRRVPRGLRRHPVVAFTLVAYGVSWALWLPLLASRQGWIQPSASSYLHLWGSLGPLAAAVAVTAATSGRRGLRDLSRRAVAWRGRAAWLALAVLGPVALFVAAVVAARLLQGTWPDLGRLGASQEYPTLPLGLYWLANLLCYGYGEEVGWRGFAQPHLQARRSPLGAAALVSLIWAGWHLPLFGITAGFRQLGPAEVLGWYLALLVGAFLLAWLYQRSRASILVVAAFHATLDITINTPTSSTLLPTLMSVALLVIGVAVIPQLRASAAQPARPPGGRDQRHRREDQPSKSPGRVTHDPPAPATAEHPGGWMCGPGEPAAEVRA